MPTVRCDGARVDLAPGESLLDGLLRAGVHVPHACRAGACQSCLVRATEGPVPREAQIGLKETLRTRGYLLACTARPTEDLSITLSGVDELAQPAQVTSIETLGPDVVRVQLTPERPLQHQAGQFVNVRRPDGLTRSYSVASLPDDGPQLELHIRVLPGGRMSGWLADRAQLGTRVEVRGPSGDCFYVTGRATQPLVLAGTGTGLAPLVGVLRAALRAGHTGPIHLVHGARTPDGLYLRHELRSLTVQHPQVTYTACALEGGADDVVNGSLDQVVATRWPSLAGHRVFLCGDPQLVTSMRKRAFLMGARLTDIHADAFVTAPAADDARPTAR